MNEEHGQAVEAGYEPAQLEKYEGGHRCSDEEFVKALDWFVDG